WFRLGDRDLATHIERTHRLRGGEPLSAICADFASRLGIRQTIVPMSDDPVRTLVDTDVGRLTFQDYFVRRQCAPKVLGLAFGGAEQARPCEALLEGLAASSLDAVIICPSNPFLSIDPILAIPGVRAALEAVRAPVVAVSPIVAGGAVKGPAAKIMQELGLAPSALAVARRYGSLIDGFVLDEADAPQAEAVGLPTLATGIVMRSVEDRARLAEEVVGFARRLR